MGRGDRCLLRVVSCFTAIGRRTSTIHRHIQIAGWGRPPMSRAYHFITFFFCRLRCIAMHVCFVSFSVSAVVCPPTECHDRFCVSGFSFGFVLGCPCNVRCWPFSWGATRVLYLVGPAHNRGPPGYAAKELAGTGKGACVKEAARLSM